MWTCMWTAGGKCFWCNRNRTPNKEGRGNRSALLFWDALLRWSYRTPNCRSAYFPYRRYRRPTPLLPALVFRSGVSTQSFESARLSLPSLVSHSQIAQCWNCVLLLTSRCVLCFWRYCVLSEFCTEETVKCRGWVDAVVFEHYREAAVEAPYLLS